MLTKFFRHAKVAVLLSQRQTERYSRPTYTIEEASRYLGIPASTMKSWVFGRTFKTSSGKELCLPLIEPADRGSGLLSFFNLVELHSLSAARFKHGVRMPLIRSALDYVKGELDVDRPLIDRRFSTDGKYMFIKEIEGVDQWINASNWGQYGLGKILDQYLERVEWDDQLNIPVSLYPRKQKDNGKIIVLNPRISSGRPIVKGSGVLANIIWQRHRAGDSIETLEKDYRLQPSEIDTAIDYIGRAKQQAA